MNEKEYIEKSVALQMLRTSAVAKYPLSFCNGLLSAANELEKMPAERVVPEQHGKWILHRDGSGTCDQCKGTEKAVWDYDSWQNFCGRCGADMRGLHAIFD